MADGPDGPEGFIRRYWAYMPRPAPATVRPLSGERLHKAFGQMAQSAPGPDGWEAADLRHMSLVAATALAAILNRVEEAAHGHIN
eukprot:9385692-Alexandrium_andersonii.AAC.1